jgi:hypothetical protein
LFLNPSPLINLFSFAVLGIESRALRLPGKPCTHSLPRRLP